MIKFIFKIISAKLNGKRDGRSQYPPADFDGENGKLSEYEKILSKDLNNAISRIIKNWAIRKEKICKEIGTLIPNLIISIDNFKEELKDTRNKYGEQANIDPIKKIKFRSFSFILFVMLLLLEAFVNIYSFRFLRESGLITIGLGIVLTIIIPFSGIIIGYNSKPKDKNWIQMIFGVILLLSSIAIITYIAKGRELMLSQKIHDEETLNIAFWIMLLVNVCFLSFSFYEGYRHSYTYMKLQNKYIAAKTRIRQFYNRKERLLTNLANAIYQINKENNFYNKLAFYYRKSNRIQRQKLFRQQPIPVYFNKDTKLQIEISENIFNNPEPIKLYEQELDKTYVDVFNKIKEFETIIKSN